MSKFAISNLFFVLGPLFFALFQFTRALQIALSLNHQAQELSTKHYFSAFRISCIFVADRQLNRNSRSLAFAAADIDCTTMIADDLIDDR